MSSSETLIPRLRSEAANWSATCGELFDEAANEIELLRKALEDAKAFVVGNKHPNWTNDFTTYVTRNKIADVCDIALRPELRTAVMTDQRQTTKETKNGNPEGCGGKGWPSLPEWQID